MLEANDPANVNATYKGLSGHFYRLLFFTKKVLGVRSMFTRVLMIDPPTITTQYFYRRL